MMRPIAIGLAPNLENDDFILAFKNLLTGKIFYNNINDLEKLEKWFEENYRAKSVYLFNSGRSALFIALKSLGLSKRDEIIVPAFTCVAVPNSILWNGAKPIYVDIDKNTLGIDPKDLKNKISKNTRAIIVQHTFGIPADIITIQKIANKYNIVVIEDCAHGIKIPYKKKFLGQFGDISIFSFGRDKAISSVFGGVLIVNNPLYIQNTSQIYATLSYPSWFWLFKQHMHSVVMAIVFPLYNFFGIGKFILEIIKKFNLITLPIYQKEKKGERPPDFPKKYHSSLSLLAFNQLIKLDLFNFHRSQIVNNYSNNIKSYYSKLKNLALLRYPLLVKNRVEVLSDFKKLKIILGNWYSNVIDPKGVDIKSIGYTTCPTAEYVAQHIINLPTYPTFSKKDSMKIIAILSKKEVL